ncbi:Protein K03A11.4 [Aphelenchoides avenae]|nr:Protein K03A11.4 [Aphelenchus avenae]
MEAINFRYVNKVGLMSRHNAYALMFGKQLYNLSITNSNKDAPPDGDDQEFCKTVLDEQPFIGFEFERRGYKTMIAEDWAMGAWNWPDCKGFTRPPADHYMRPFMFVYESTYHWRHKLVRAQCRGFHLYLLDYLKQFLDVYDDKPKFSITWLDLAHDTPNGLYPFDDVFLQFLNEYKAKLNNDFIYLMGDHGLRHGGIRATKQGELEDNNPAMVLAVPEHLRRNQNLMSNLNANSKQLVTHYDTYATLVNIARVSMEGRWVGTSRKAAKGIY